MRLPRPALLACLVLTFATAALAGEDFDVNVSGGTVTVTAKAGWHINDKYPWKLVVGDVKLDKSKFTLSEAAAKVSGAPRGSGELSGAVCSDTACVPFKKTVTIP